MIRLPDQVAGLRPGATRAHRGAADDEALYGEDGVHRLVVEQCSDDCGGEAVAALQRFGPAYDALSALEQDNAWGRARVDADDAQQAHNWTPPCAGRPASQRIRVVNAALVTGLFGVVVLLVKAAVDAGSRSRRVREAISADLALLKAWPENVGGADELKAKLEAQVRTYTGAVDAPEPADAELLTQALAEQRREKRNLALLQYGALLATAVSLCVGAIGFVASSESELVELLTSDTAALDWSTALVVSAVLLLAFAFLAMKLVWRASR